MAKKEIKKIGRPTAKDEKDVVIDEKATEPLQMADHSKPVTVEDVNAAYKHAFDHILSVGRFDPDIGRMLNGWNRLNPFLQNQRLKTLNSQAVTYSKAQLGAFAADPANHEQELRSASLTASSSQQIYYNILRRSCDVPKYDWYLVLPYLEESEYKSDKLITEYMLATDWCKVFNIPNTLKTVALQVKREGKASYLLRTSFSGTGKQKHTNFATFEKLPPDWVKITGIGQLGYTVSFNFAYFLQAGFDPKFFGPYFVACWDDIINHQIVYRDGMGNLQFDAAKARNYQFTWEGQTYTSMFESDFSPFGQTSFLFWIQLPFNIVFTFGSDNSHPYASPDTSGLLQKLQELTDYGTLAGLIASTPLTAVLTGEAEYVDNARPGLMETKISPEVLAGLQDMFNAMTSSNIEAYFLPLKNIKLQQLNADVNSSDIVTKATENLVTQAGEGGLTIVDTKPNVSMVKAAELLAASQQRYVTLQFENVLTYIIQHNLGFSYRFDLKIWGDIFTDESSKKILKEEVAGGNMALFPKLMSSEGLTLLDATAMTRFVKSVGIYKMFETLTTERQAELGGKKSENDDTNQDGERQVGRPALDDDEIDNDATAASRDAGTDTTDNREQMSTDNLCPVCHHNHLEDGQIVCEECEERILENRS